MDTVVTYIYCSYLSLRAYGIASKACTKPDTGVDCLQEARASLVHASSQLRVLCNFVNRFSANDGIDTDISAKSSACLGSSHQRLMKALQPDQVLTGRG